MTQKQLAHARWIEQISRDIIRPVFGKRWDDKGIVGIHVDVINCPVTGLPTNQVYYDALSCTHRRLYDDRCLAVIHSPRDTQPYLAAELDLPTFNPVWNRMTNREAETLHDRMLRTVAERKTAADVVASRPISK